MNVLSIRFFFCNLFVSILLMIVLLTKKLLGKYLSGHSQYHIWFLLPVILAVPFLPFRPSGPAWLLSRLHFFWFIDTSVAEPAISAASLVPSSDWISDFGVSADGMSSSAADWLLVLLWALGTLATAVSLVRSRIRLYRLEQSALPLQNPEVQKLYETCVRELNIQKRIPIYSTAFLRSPILVGLFHPRICLPIHLISDLCPSDMRYMLLHELCHYKQKDAWINTIMNTAVVIYWFNPILWYLLKEVRNDQEIACDTFVLQMLDAGEHLAYGHTLLHFAQKISQSAFLLSSGMGGSTGQLKRRILNIAQYRPCTGWRRIKERMLVAVLTVLILESTAFIPVFAAEQHIPLPKNAMVQEEDLSSFFSGNEGCFVLYDSGSNIWRIYNESLAARRISPDSTCKIYSALCALENGYITPDASEQKWNRQPQPYPQWNQDQTLATAMKNSVNWYFQALDLQAGPDTLGQFYKKINYGNHDLSGGVTTFWMESSLKISALEQVELLSNFYTNSFGFDDRNIQAVRESLVLSASGPSVLSGKTGTGIIDGQTVSSWFIGYVETSDNTFFFAANIQNPSDTEKLTASQLTLRILEAEEIFP